MTLLPRRGARRDALAAVTTLTFAISISSCSGGSKVEPSHATVPTQPTANAPASDAGAGAANRNGAAGANDQASTDASLASKESKAVARTLVRVSEIRGIKASRAVPGVKLDRDQLVARVKDKALREYPADALRREGQLLQLMGFAPTTFDYMNEMMKLLEAQLEGFYEPKNGTMYLAADLKGKEAQATLAHELVHALQDQMWDLKSRSSYRPGKGDETLALACLAEGDATSVMMDFIMREQNRTALDLPEPMLRELMASGVNSGGAIQSVPHILRSTLIAPYVDGIGFVHALRKKSVGGGWSMVDKAWEKPPMTTEQVLHVAKWEQHEPPIPMDAPTSVALGSGWKLDDEDSFGELGFALTYEEWVDPVDARTAAQDWGGDRSSVYVRGDEIAFAVRTRYDAATAPRTDTYATRGMTKIAAGLKKTFASSANNNTKPSIDTADTLCFDRKDLGPIILARRARDLVLAAGPARETKASWASTSSCTQAKRWADEILAMPR